MNKLYYKKIFLFVFSIILYSCNSSPYIKGKWQLVDKSTIFFLNSNGTYAIKNAKSINDNEEGTYKLKIRNSSKGDIIYFQSTQNGEKIKYSKKIRLKKNILELGNIYDDKWTSKYKNIK